MSRLNIRLGKLEAAAGLSGYSRRWALVKGALADADLMAARFNIVGGPNDAVCVTDLDWKGGEPELVSPLLYLNDMSDAALDLFERVVTQAIDGVKQGLELRAVDVECLPMKDRMN